LVVSFDEHPYLVDHAITCQPYDWVEPDDFNLVVPLTMTIELLADEAMKHCPVGKRLVRITNVLAFKWIDVQKDRPFDEPYRGQWGVPGEELTIELVNHAKATFHFADEWPVPPAGLMGEFDIGEPIMDPPPTAEELYDGYAFHGPKYHSSTRMISINQRGMVTMAEQKEGKGSLMDVEGQQLGVFLHLMMSENTVSFPTHVDEIVFYDDYRNQGGEFVHTLLITRLDDKNIVGNMVLVRDGKPWSLTRGFTCQRFLNDRPVWFVLLKPQFNKLAHEVAPGVFYYSSALRGGIVTFLYYRFLNFEDKAKSVELRLIPRQHEFLIASIATKDAVRISAARRDDSEEMIFPIEIFIDHDDNGAPRLRTQDKYAGYLDGMHLSTADNGLKAMAAVSFDGPVGVDMMLVADCDAEFVARVFDDGEPALLQQAAAAGQWTPEEAAARLWVAREACAKRQGADFKEAAAGYRVVAVDGEVVTIRVPGADGAEVLLQVQTAVVDDGCIGGWTL
jgi:phosphopantetheinyl transferase (holo-ACP synthase)